MRSKRRRDADPNAVPGPADPKYQPQPDSSHASYPPYYYGQPGPMAHNMIERREMPANEEPMRR